MKNTKLLILTAFTALTLAGCGNINNNPASLPNGGTDVNVKEETGKATMKARLEGASDAYKNLNLTALGLNAETKDATLSLNGKVESSIGNFEGKLGLEDFGMGLEIAMGEVETNLAARATLKETKGKFGIDGKIKQSGAEEANDIKQSIDLSGVLLNAYLLEDKLYLDGSDQSVLNLLDRGSGFADGLVSDLGLNFLQLKVLAMMAEIDLSPVLNSKQDGFDFKSAYVNATNGGKGFISLPSSLPWMNVQSSVANYADSFKEISAETGKSTIDEFVDTFVQLSEKVSGLTFKTYGDKGFGFQIDITKESLKTLITSFSDEMNEEKKAQAKEASDQLDKYLTKFDVSSSIYFNNDGLLESIASYINVEANVKMEESELQDSPVTLVDLVVVAKETSKITVSYNDAVQLKLPTADQLTDYQEIVIPEEENEQAQE